MQSRREPGSTQSMVVDGINEEWEVSVPHANLALARAALCHAAALTARWHQRKRSWRPTQHSFQRTFRHAGSPLLLVDEFMKPPAGSP